MPFTKHYDFDRIDRLLDNIGWMIKRIKWDNMWRFEALCVPTGGEGWWYFAMEKFTKHVRESQLVNCNKIKEEIHCI